MTRTALPQPSQSDYAYLCGNCGTISPDEDWRAFKMDDEGEHMIPAGPNDSDPIMRCPTCRFDFDDDDSGPALWGGSRAEMEAERAGLVAEPNWSEWWAEALEQTGRRGSADPGTPDALTAQQLRSFPAAQTVWLAWGSNYGLRAAVEDEWTLIGIFASNDGAERAAEECAAEYDDERIIRKVVQP